MRLSSPFCIFQESGSIYTVVQFNKIKLYLAGKMEFQEGCEPLITKLNQ